MIINDNLNEREDIIGNHVVDYYQMLYHEGATSESHLIQETVMNLVTENQNDVLYLLRRKFIAPFVR